MTVTEDPLRLSQKSDAVDDEEITSERGVAEAGLSVRMDRGEEHAKDVYISTGADEHTDWCEFCLHEECTVTMRSGDNAQACSFVRQF